MKSYLLMVAMLFVFALAGLSPVSSFAADKPAQGAALTMIHLNQATAEELQSLPGVGPALSERIIVFRNEHGPFRNLDDLAQVKGVGQVKLAKLKKQLTLD